MIILFLLNVALTMMWMLLTQSATFLNGVLGFIVSALVLTLAARASGQGGYLGRIINLFHFAGYFLYILTKANLDVAWEIITPGFHMKPRIIRYDVRGLTAIQVTTLANAITLTPGTLSADVDEEGNTLYIHAMYAQQRGDAIAELDKLKHKLLWLVFALTPLDIKKAAA